MIDNTFLLCDLMGVGGSSKVYSTKDEQGQEFALKIIRKDKGYSPELSKKLVENEHLIGARLGPHPNLVNILGYNSDGTAVLADGVHSINYLVLEKCKHGALSNIVRQTGPLEENVAKFLFVQLCAAVKYFHENNYAHMDLKLENILLDDYFNIKVADLGTAVDVSETMGYTSKRRGTPHYMAPEIKSKKQDQMIDAYMADVYSLGICLHLLLTGEFPEENSMGGDSSVETEVSGDMPEDLKAPKKGRIQYVSEDARDLLEEMLEDNTFFRISLDEILQHPWIRNNELSDEPSLVYQELMARYEATTSS